MDDIFTTLNSGTICKIISTINKELFLVTPSLNDNVALEILDLSKQHPEIRIEVIVDNSSNAIRLGYGSLTALETLTKNDIIVRSQKGIRIGVLIADDVGCIFNPTPQIIEEEPSSRTSPNSIKLSSSEVKRITSALYSNLDTITEENESNIGQNIIEKEEFRQIKNDLTKHPPIKPDLARKMMIINSTFQLVEIHLIGAKLQSKTFSLTPQDLGIKDENIAKRIRANYNILGKNELDEVKHLESSLTNIKEKYLIPVESFGSLILYKNRKAFDDTIKILENEIKNIQTGLVEKVEIKLKESKQTLLPMIIENFKLLRKDEIKSILFPFPDDDDSIHEYILRKIDSKFPKAEELLSNIKCTVRITNVSDQLINDEDFREKVEKAFGKDFDEVVKLESAISATEEC